MLYRKIIIGLLIFIAITCTVSANAVDTIEENLDMPISEILMVVTTCGIVVISALDTRIAIMLGTLLYTSLFILFYLATEQGYTGFNPYYPGVAMMMCLVILSLALLIPYKKANTPYHVA